MISTQLCGTRRLLLFCLMAALIANISPPPAAGQQNDAGSKPATKTRRTFTNDDIGIAGSASSSDASSSDDGIPPIPGLIKCGQDVDCFLQALDKNTPATVTRDERLELGGVVLSSNSVWWTSRVDPNQVVVWLRVDAFDASMKEGAELPKANHDTAVAKMSELNRNFENIRGKNGTCLLPTSSLKAMMKSTWSLMSLGIASGFGKNCTGPAFEDDHK